MCKKAAEEFECSHKHFKEGAVTVKCGKTDCQGIVPSPITKKSGKCTWCKAKEAAGS
jgi:hypothetical protein